MRDHFNGLLTIAALIGVLVLSWMAATPFDDGALAQQTVQRETFSRCDSAGVSSAAIDTASSGNVELVALVSGDIIHVCGFGFESDTATTSVQFIYGTGTACATGETDLTGPMTVLASTPVAVANGGATQFRTAASNALCIELGAATQVNGWVTYYQE